jgi:hypothetical protein
MAAPACPISRRRAGLYLGAVPDDVRYAVVTDDTARAKNLGRVRSYQYLNSFLMNFTSSPARIVLRKTKSRPEEQKAMKLALRNFGAATRSRTGGLDETPLKYWDEDDRRARYNAVSDALWLYQDREVEPNLRRFGWRQARRRVLAQGALSREWRNRGRGELRLTRRGLQMRFASGVRTIGWNELKDMIDARRS